MNDRPPPPTAVASSREASRPATSQRGALLWDFVATFVGARSAFQGVFRVYERRVLRAARDRGVTRADLVLPPGELWRLFHERRLQSLRDNRLGPLRELAQEIFGPDGDPGLMDTYCAHVYHEISVLSEEHRSVGRFLRQADPRRYREFFEEVSRYYPMRLRRVRRFFEAARARLEELLAEWSERRVIVRSVYVFGEQLARRTWGRGREAFYEHMYPEGGPTRGYLEAARSFQASGFLEKAREAYEAAVRAAAEIGEERSLDAPEAAALEEARRRLSELPAAPAPTA